MFGMAYMYQKTQLKTGSKPGEDTYIYCGQVAGEHATRCRDLGSTLYPIHHRYHLVHILSWLVPTSERNMAYNTQPVVTMCTLEGVFQTSTNACGPSATLQGCPENGFSRKWRP